MAELSGFRRFSYQAQRRQSMLPRKSIVSIATTAQPTGHSWLYVLRSMYKQTFSLSPGFSLCICSIIISNYFYYFNIYDNVSGQEQSHDPIKVFAVANYFLGACIGSIVCGLNHHTWPAKKSNYVVGTVLMISNGFLFWINTVTLCIARILAGFAYGFIYIALMTHIADNVMKTVRGYIATTISISTTLGLILGVGFSKDLFKSDPYLRWIFNLVTIAPVIASIVLTPYLTYEPVTLLLKLDLESEARSVLYESRNGLIDAATIQYEIDGKRRMLLEDYDDKSQRCGFEGVLSNGNAMTILLMLILRLLNVLTSNVYLYIISAISIHQESNFVILIILLSVRILVLFIPKYSIDKLGRKGLLLASGLGSGILLLPFATQQMNYINIRNDLLAIIIFGIHIFAALGIDPVQHIYASEAFPLNKRNASLAIVTCIEYILHATIIILVLLEQNDILEIALLITPFATILMTIISFAKLPETKTLASRRCRDQFNKNTVKKPFAPRISGIQTLGSTYI